MDVKTAPKFKIHVNSCDAVLHDQMRQSTGDGMKEEPTEKTAPFLMISDDFAA
jgi:hypothetical protein